MLIIKYIATVLAGIFLAAVIIWIGKECVKDTAREIRRIKAWLKRKEPPGAGTPRRQKKNLLLLL